MNKRLIIMRPKLLLAATGISLLLAYPVSLTLKHRDDIIQSQQKTIHSLQIKSEQIKSKPVSTIKPSAQAVIPPVAVSKPVTPVAAATPAPVQPVAQAPTVVHTAAVGCSNYLSDFQKYSWSVSTAMAICQAESGGNPSAVSATCDRGLMQVNCVHSDMVNYDLSALYDPATNIAVAYRIYTGAGWSAWTTYTSGKYLNYL